MKQPLWKYLVNVLIGATFIIYLLLLFYLTIGKASSASVNGGSYRYNLILGKSIAEYVKYVFDGGAIRNVAIINLLGNLIMLFPMACYLAYFIKTLRSLWKDTFAVFIIVIIIEIIQLLTGKGSLDIDDIILNTMGVMLGYGFWKLKSIQWIVNKVQL